MMTLTTLTQAIYAGQLILLLRPLAGGKSGEKRIESLRSLLHEFVASAGTEARSEKAAEAIEQLYLGLKKGVLEFLQPKMMVEVHTKGRGSMASRWSSAFNTSKYSIHRSREDFFSRLTQDAVRAHQYYKALVGGLSARDVAERGQRIHLFASLVRNHQWLGVLGELELDLQSSIAADADLSALYSSRPGRARLNEVSMKLAGVEVTPAPVKPKRAPRGKCGAAPSYDVAKLAIVSVCLDGRKLVEMPEVRSVYPTSPAADKAEPKMVDLLRAATSPLHVPLSEAQATADTMLSVFTRGLAARAAAVEKIRKANAKKAEEAKREKTLAALRGLGEPVLAMLKAHPELLQKV